jgi:hypothetical protein
MARKEGLRPIGESLKPIIERIKKQREERRRKNKPIRTQPKLPGMKKGGAVEPKYSVEDEVKSRMKKETPRTGYGIGLSPVTQMRRKLSGKAAGAGALGAVPGMIAGLSKLGRDAADLKRKDPNKDKRSPGRPGGRGKKEDKRRKIRYMTPLAKKAQGGMAFGGEKRIPGSGAAFRGTGFKGIF